MEIKSVRTAKTESIKGKKSASTSGAFADFSHILESSNDVPQKTPLSAASSVVSIWATQEVESPLEKRKKAVRKGQDILESLSELQKSIGTSQDSTRTIRQIQFLLLEKLDAHGDPQLQDLLDAISLRAAVEAAKFGL